MNASNRSVLAGLTLCLWLGLCGLAHAQEPTSLAELKTRIKNPDEVARIEQALPRQAIVPPRQPRRLLIFDLNVNYGGHGSIPHANLACALMGEKTGAFKTVVSRDPEIFARASLSRFDAVFFNNNVGNLFTNAELRRSLLEFVCGGGGLLGVHGTSVAFTRWPGALEDWDEFGLMIGTRGANHRESTEAVFVKLDDPENPLNRVFGGQGFIYRDEYFRPQDPYSRQRVRVLLSMDVARTEANQGRSFGNLERADKDFAVAWIRNYGRGRSFYCTIAHNPYVFWDPKMLEFYLGAIQFALGDLPAPTIPSGKLTPALRAQEKLGWRVGLEVRENELTFFEAIDLAAQLGLAYVGGTSRQRLSPQLAKPFGPDLADDELKQARLKLDAAGVRLLTYAVPALPADEAGCRKLFEFGRKMGIETFIATRGPQTLDAVEKLCETYRINLALQPGGGKASSVYPNLDQVLVACAGHGSRIGVCADLANWLGSGVDTMEMLQKCQKRLITVQWGYRPRVDDGQTEAVLKKLRQLGLQPTMLSLPCAALQPAPAAPQLKTTVEVFNELSLNLAK